MPVPAYSRYRYGKVEGQGIPPPRRQDQEPQDAEVDPAGQPLQAVGGAAGVNYNLVAEARQEMRDHIRAIRREARLNPEPYLEEHDRLEPIMPEGPNEDVDVEKIDDELEDTEEKKKNKDTTLYFFPGEKKGVSIFNPINVVSKPGWNVNKIVAEIEEAKRKDTLRVRKLQRMKEIPRYLTGFSPLEYGTTCHMAYAEYVRLGRVSHRPTWYNEYDPADSSYPFGFTVFDLYDAFAFPFEEPNPHFMKFKEIADRKKAAKAEDVRRRVNAERILKPELRSLHEGPLGEEDWDEEDREIHEWLYNMMEFKCHICHHKFPSMDCLVAHAPRHDDAPFAIFGKLT